MCCTAMHTYHKSWQVNLSPTRPAHSLVLFLTIFAWFLYGCGKLMCLIEEHLPFHSHALPQKSSGNGNPPLANEFMWPVVCVWLSLRRPLGMKMHDLLWWWIAFSYHFCWKFFGNAYICDGLTFPVDLIYCTCVYFTSPGSSRVITSVKTVTTLTLMCVLPR